MSTPKPTRTSTRKTFPVLRSIAVANFHTLSSETYSPRLWRVLPEEVAAHTAALPSVATTIDHRVGQAARGRGRPIGGGVRYGFERVLGIARLLRRDGGCLRCASADMRAFPVPGLDHAPRPACRQPGDRYWSPH